MIKNPRNASAEKLGFQTWGKKKEKTHVAQAGNRFTLEPAKMSEKQTRAPTPISELHRSVLEP